MTNIVQVNPNTLDTKIIESVLITGNLASLSAEQKIAYHNKVCETLGLNPLTKPFDYITMNNRLVMYARKDATDQLRKRFNVSIKIVKRESSMDLYAVTAQATMPDGRTDEAMGAVSVKGLAGEGLANALMKAETKAKRRVTLSICGLGLLDESELESTGEASPEEQKKAKQVEELIHAQQPEQKNEEYIVSFGDFAGQKITDIAVADLKKYVEKVEVKAKEQKKQIKGVVAEFLQKAKDRIRSDVA